METKTKQKQTPDKSIQVVPATEVVVEDKEEMSNGMVTTQDRLSLMTPNQLREQVKIETKKRMIITNYIKQHMVEGVDYGKIHINKDCRDKKNCKEKWHWSKDTLFKPGAEKFCSLFRYKAEYCKDADTWEMLGSIPGTIALICKLYTSESNIIVGEGRGICSVKEKDGNANVAVKICEKRAKINAVLQTGGLSDFFTQDLEDMGNDKEKDSLIPVWSADTRQEVIKFGKNKGTKWCDVDLNYLEWASANAENRDLVEFVRAELNHRTPESGKKAETPEPAMTKEQKLRIQELTRDLRIPNTQRKVIETDIDTFSKKRADKCLAWLRKVITKTMDEDELIFDAEDRLKTCNTMDELDHLYSEMGEIVKKHPKIMKIFRNKSTDLSQEKHELPSTYPNT